MEYEPSCEEQAAGLLYLYNNENCIALLATRNEVVCQRFERGGIRVSFSDATGAEHIAFLLVDRFNVSFVVEGTRLPLVLDASHLCDEASGFTGTHIALYAHDMTGGGMPCAFRMLRVGRL